MRKKIYARFKNVLRQDMKKLLNYLDKELGGLDKYDLISADEKNDLDGLVLFLKNEYGLVVPNEVFSEKAQIEKAKLEEAKIEKIEEERLVQETTKKLLAQYNDISEITDSPKFRLAKQFIELSCSSNVGIVLVGKQGTGKSTLIRAILSDLKKNYSVLSTATTHIDLVKFLWEHKNKDLVVFEDVAGLWISDKINSLMRQVLGNINEDKVIYKGTPDYRVRDIDNQFVFKPNVIIVCNEIKNKTDEQVKAILDRCAKPLNIELSNKELMLMFKVILEKSKSLSEIEKDTIMKFVQENSSEATEMSLRTIHKIVEYYHKDKLNWKTLSLHELQVNPVKQLIIEVRNGGYQTIEDEVKAFKEKANRAGLPSSRASFFNYSKEMKPQIAMVY